MSPPQHPIPPPRITPSPLYPKTFPAHPILGTSPPSKTTNAAFKTASPKMFTPNPPLLCSPPKHILLPFVTGAYAIILAGIATRAVAPIPITKSGAFASQGNTTPPYVWRASTAPGTLL